MLAWTDTGGNGWVPEAGPESPANGVTRLQCESSVPIMRCGTSALDFVILHDCKRVPSTEHGI